jgi:hypothetical protein
MTDDVDAMDRREFLVAAAVLLYKAAARGVPPEQVIDDAR